LITWKHETQPYVKNVGVYKCPSNPQNNQPDETGGGDKFGYTVFPISYAYNGTILWNSLGPNEPVLHEADVPESSRYLMLIESNSACSDMGIWGFPAGYFVHRTHRMQALFCDGHAKATKFSQTLGTSWDDQQWSFLTYCGGGNCKKIIDNARRSLQDPKVFAAMD
jgi:prepilin-type processing-associated H-X9-DG protein